MAASAISTFLAGATTPVRLGGRLGSSVGGAPGPMQNVVGSVPAGTSGTARIVDELPEVLGGSPLTGIRRTRNDPTGTLGGDWSTLDAPDSRSRDFIYLPAGVYTLTTRAVNAQGDGPATSVQVTVTATAPTNTASSSPLLAKTFVESSGVCMHFGRGGIWDGHTQIKSLLANSGLKMVRGSWTPGDTRKRVFAQELRRDLGISFIYWTGQINQFALTAIRDEIKAANAGQPGTVFAIEGPNEQDFNSGLRQWTINTWNTLKADPDTAGIMVYGPSMANVNNSGPYQNLGNIDAYVDKVNMHAYMGDKFIVNDALINDLYAFAAFNLDSPIGAAELMNSEFGISNGTTAVNPPQPTLPEQYRAQHILSMWTATWRRGVWPNAIFSMFAEGGDAWYQGLGLCNDDYTPQTSFTFMGNMVSILADPGADFTPATFAYTLTGTDSRTRSFPLWKRDGSLWLVVWQEDTVYNGFTRTVLNPPSPTVTVGGFPSARNVSRFKPDSRNAFGAVSGATSYAFPSTVLPTIVKVAS